MSLPYEILDRRIQMLGCICDRWFKIEKKKDRLNVHVEDFNSARGQVWRKYNALVNKNQHIGDAINKQSDLTKGKYKVQLTTTVDYIRLLLKLGMTFCGDDESANSKNKCNFSEILQFLCNHNKEFDKISKKSRENLKFVSPIIQKDIIKVVDYETTKIIINDFNNNLFSILIDESRNVLIKEKMVFVLY